MSSRLLILSVLLFLVGLTACATPTAAPTSVPPTVAAPSTRPLAGASSGQGATTGNLTPIKGYLLGKTGELKTQSAALTAAANQYFDLAKGANFDYTALWASKGPEVIQTIQTAREAWKAASPTYEQMEGIVAGVPSLRDYDVILDAGASGKESPDNPVPFDLTLGDGRVLPKPGNLFGVTESTLWGTDEEYIVKGIRADFDGNGKQEFGETLPDAYVLKAGAETLSKYANELDASAQQWTPTESDAFSALVVMVPTMSEYFESWKNSRFVAGDASTQRDFVAISRLSDIQNILGSLQIVYASLKPQIAANDAAQAEQIDKQLADMKAFVAGVYSQEQSGKHFTAEEADTLGAETQDRATAIAGEITQVAEKLNIEIVE